MFAEAKSEILKQECKVDSLNACIHDKLILTGWNWTVQTVGVKNPEESKPHNTKNCRYEKKYFEILEVKYENSVFFSGDIDWRSFRSCRWCLCLSSSLYLSLSRRSGCLELGPGLHVDGGIDRAFGAPGAGIMTFVAAYLYL